MQISGRNQLEAKITGVKKGPINSEITMDVGGQTMAAMITTSSTDKLNLNVGDSVKALIKASSVMIMK